MNPLKKLQQVLKPERMYRINLAGSFLNLGFAVVAWAIGLPPAFAHIFIVSGFCFAVGAGANWAMVKIQKEK